MSGFHEQMAARADFVETVADFKKRLFSGHDVLQFMDSAGVGVGATMHAVRQAEIQHELHPETYRKLDGSKASAYKHGALIAISEQVRAIEALHWWQFRKRKLHWLAIRDTLTVVLDEGMITRGSRVG